MSVSPAVPATPRKGMVVLALLLVYVVWGSTFLGIRLALEAGLQPLSMVSGSRFIVAGLLLYAVLRLRRVAAPTPAQWRNIAIMGFCLLFLGNGMVVLAQRQVSSGLAAVAVASVPLWMALFTALRGGRIGRGEWLGIVLGLAGIVWLNADSQLTAVPLALGLLLLAPLGWSFGSVWSRGRNLPSPFMTAAGQMLCGGVVLVVAGLLAGERWTEVPPLSGLLAVTYLCLFGSVVAFSAYVWLLHNVRPVLASSYAYVNPLIAVGLGTWLAGERFSATEVGAMALILSGVAVISLARSKRA